MSGGMGKGKTSSGTSHGRKRKERTEVEAASSTSGDVEKLLVGFGADFTKTMQNKKRKIETFTQETLECSKKKMKEVNSKQSTERKKVLDSYTKQVDVILKQWEEDLSCMKDGEEKMSLVLKQYQSQSRQQRLTMLQRYKTMQTLKDEFSKSIEQLEENHEKQLNSIHDEMKEEMAQLRKKVLMESQQQEMSTVKDSLTKLLAQMGEE